MQTFNSDELNRIREDFYLRGESVAAWSRKQGFDPNMVYQVLSGRCLGRRGTSHQIALALGLKKPYSCGLERKGLLTSEETRCK